MRKGEMDIFFLLLVVLYLAGGSMIYTLMTGAYHQENELEGIGFRQTAILEAYHQVHALQSYVTTIAKQAYLSGVIEFFNQGLRTAPNEGTADPCGTVGGYHSWFNGNSCIINVTSDLPQGLREQTLRFFKDYWNYLIVPDKPSYSLRLASSELVGTIQQDITLPIVGVHDDDSKKAYTVVMSQRKALFSTDASFNNIRVIPDPDRKQRLQNPTTIVLHYTVNNGLEQAKDIMLRKGLSIHYIVGRDGSIIQMVPEDEVAYHAGGCGDPNEKCALVNMNQQSIGIEMVNFGWWHPNNGDNTKPFIKPTTGCPDGYSVAPRDCSYTSYNNYLVGSYDGKQACLNDPKNICWQKYTDAQVDMVKKLVADIATRNSIAPEDIISHESIKSEKYDPGPLFDIEAVRSFLRSYDGTVKQTSAGLNWFTGIRVVNSCSADKLMVESQVNGEVYAVAPGEVLGITCDDTCVVIRHSDSLVSKIEGVKPRVVAEDRVYPGQIVGRAISNEVSIQFFDKWGGTAQLPLCHFSRIEDVTAKSNCEAYTSEQAGKQVFDRTKFLESCTEVDITVGSKCLVDTDVTGNRKKERTLGNLESFTHKGEPLLNWVRSSATKIDVGFLLGIVTQESEGNPNAVSATGCAGIGQFCYNTAVKQFPKIFKTVIKCSCTRTGTGICSRTEHNSNCKANDDRFDPEKSLKAANEYLAGFLKEYKAYEDKYYFAAARYNSGDGELAQDGILYKGLKHGIEQCSTAVTWTCVKPFIRPEGQDYAEKVVEYAKSWGLTGAVGSCQNIPVKNLGSITVPLDFSVPVIDVNTPLKALAAWATETSKVNNDLSDNVLVRVAKDLKDWSVEQGFCEETPGKNFVNEVKRNLQDCADNGQSQCFCDFLPKVSDDVQGLDDQLYLVFDNEGFISLWGKDYLTGDDFFGSVQHIPLTKVQLTDKTKGVEYVEEIVMSFSKKGISEVRIKKNGKLENTKYDAKGLYTVGAFLGYLDAIIDAHSLNTQKCLPTRERFAFCAEEQFIEQRKDEAPYTVKFGMHLIDDHSPQPAMGLVVQDILGKLRATWTTIDKDNVGHLVYCNKVGKEYGLPKRVSGKNSLDLDWCVKKNKKGTYKVLVVSVDGAGNLRGKNSAERVPCVNEAIYSYDLNYLTSAVFPLGFANGCQSSPIP